MADKLIDTVFKLTTPPIREPTYCADGRIAPDFRANGARGCGDICLASAGSSFDPVTRTCGQSWDPKSPRYTPKEIQELQKNPNYKFWSDVDVQNALNNINNCPAGTYKEGAICKKKADACTMNMCPDGQRKNPNDCSCPPSVPSSPKPYAPGDPCKGSPGCIATVMCAPGFKQEGYKCIPTHGISPLNPQFVKWQQNPNKISRYGSIPSPMWSPEVKDVQMFSNTSTKTATLRKKKNAKPVTRKCKCKKPVKKATIKHKPVKKLIKK